MGTKYSVVFACLLMVFLLVAVIPTNVYAAEVASGSCGDNVTWSLDDAGVLTVTGTGAMKDYEFAHETGTTAPWCAAGLPKLTEVIIGEGITHISKYGFAACSELKKVTIPDTVVTMGENAFGGCDSLVTVELPVNMTLSHTVHLMIVIILYLLPVVRELEPLGCWHF